jgi:thiol-disulfide isomerase/thioredoxin
MRVAAVILLLVSFTVVSAGRSMSERAQGSSDLSIEERIVKYLREHVRPGERLIVSDLHNDVFKTPEERKVLDKMFNVFFKIPLFVAQYKSSTNQIPTLADLARQFNLPVPGEVAVLLSIMDDDPRVPKFITRDPKTGEITSVDVEAVRRDRRFGQLLERSLTGWVGRDAAPFSLDLLDGTQLLSDDLKGKNFLLYFWFSGCPPCVRIAPHLVELQKQFGKKNFTVIAVNADRFLELDTTNDQIIAYGKKAGFNFPVGHLNKNMHEAYGSVNVYPTLFLVDSTGIIRKHYVNYQPLSVLATDVEALP